MKVILTANRPWFDVQGPDDLSADVTAVPVGWLMLSGPSERHDAARWPVRGDLAHIALAGRCFVPHYAVPMPHVVTAPGAALRRLAAGDADVLQHLAAGDGFDVLDMSGGWCWGQAAGSGFVGYVPHDRLVAAGGAP